MQSCVSERARTEPRARPTPSTTTPILYAHGAKVGLCGLVALLLLLLVQHADSKRRRMRPKEAVLEEKPGRETAAIAPPASAGLEDDESLLKGCGRLFIDGGSNTGESVRAFLGGGMFVRPSLANSNTATKMVRCRGASGDANAAAQGANELLHTFL